MTSCQDEDPLIFVLGQPCISADDGMVILQPGSKQIEILNIGACSTGVVDVGADGKEICVGEIRKTSEQCNGIDDNCNGTTDEGTDLVYSNILNVCDAPTGACQYNSATCQNGVFVCNVHEDCHSEVCDGIDNDSDGLVDEDTVEEPLFSERFYYTGPIETINVGVCRSGVKRCIDGTIQIVGEVIPLDTEVCGNDLDENCDGTVDEAESYDDADYLLVVDFSGSMSSINNFLADMLCNWANQQTLRQSRFAVIGIGVGSPNNINNSVPQTVKVTDFTDSLGACVAIRQTIRNRGSHEYAMEAIYFGTNAENPEYLLSWQQSNRRVLVFTDEPPQASALTQSAIDRWFLGIKNQCIQPNPFSVSVFTSASVDQMSKDRWQDLIDSCNATDSLGSLNFFSNDRDSMVSALNYAIKGRCKN
jgi:hypothetical protein